MLSERSWNQFPTHNMQHHSFPLFAPIRHSAPPFIAVCYCLCPYHDHEGQRLEFSWEKKKSSTSVCLISFWLLSHDHLLPVTMSQLFWVCRMGLPCPFKAHPGSWPLSVFIKIHQDLCPLVIPDPCQGKTKQSPNLVLLLISQWRKAFRKWQGRSVFLSPHCSLIMAFQR